MNWLSTHPRFLAELGQTLHHADPQRASWPQARHPAQQQLLDGLQRHLAASQAREAALQAQLDAQSAELPCCARNTPPCNTNNTPCKCALAWLTKPPAKGYGT